MEDKWSSCSYLNIMNVISLSLPFEFVAVVDGPCFMTMARFQITRLSPKNKFSAVLFLLSCPRASLKVGSTLSRGTLLSCYRYILRVGPTQIARHPMVWERSNWANFEGRHVNWYPPNCKFLLVLINEISVWLLESKHVHMKECVTKVQTYLINMTWWK